MLFNDKNKQKMLQMNYDFICCILISFLMVTKIKHAEESIKFYTLNIFHKLNIFVKKNSDKRVL